MATKTTVRRTCDGCGKDLTKDRHRDPNQTVERDPDLYNMKVVVSRKTWDGVDGCSDGYTTTVQKLEFCDGKCIQKFIRAVDSIRSKKLPKIDWDEDYA